MGGIINIITKKKVAGYNGTLGAAVATADGSSTINRLLNIKYKKFGISSYLLTSGYTDQKSRSFEEIGLPYITLQLTKLVKDYKRKVYIKN